MEACSVLAPTSGRPVEPRLEARKSRRVPGPAESGVVVVRFVRELQGALHESPKRLVPYTFLWSSGGIEVKIEASCEDQSDAQMWLSHALSTTGNGPGSIMRAADRCESRYHGVPALYFIPMILSYLPPNWISPPGMSNHTVGVLGSSSACTVSPAGFRVWEHRSGTARRRNVPKGNAAGQS